MTLPHSPSARKSRLGLYLPFAVAAVGVAAWSLGWMWARGELLSRLDAGRDRLRASGWNVAWSARAVSGYPFRLDLAVTGLSLREPSGWGVAAPRLEAETTPFAPDHWIAVAPAGVTINRPLGGPLEVRGRVLRASVSHTGEHPPRISVEGLDLTFATPPDARPFFLSAAREFHLHAKAGPDDQGAAMVEIDSAKARLGGLVGRIADGGPVSLIADGIFSHAQALAGRDWADAVRAWSGQGGAVNLRRLELTAGAAVLTARAGDLGVDTDGRLRGQMQVELRQAPRALDALRDGGTVSPGAADTARVVVAAAAQGPAARLSLGFQAGQTTLGPVALAPAPRVY